MAATGRKTVRDRSGIITFTGSDQYNMGFNGLSSFLHRLRQKDDVLTIRKFVDPDLQMSEIADRFVKQDGSKALLFKNNGTDFPVAMNLFASADRLSEALHVSTPEAAAEQIAQLSDLLEGGGSILRKLFRLAALASLLPRRKRGRGACQQVVHHRPDLSILPILTCWPNDGGRFITLPLVHTRDPESGSLNVGMYRVQIFDKAVAALHWHRHKTGARHFEKYRRMGKKMPVAVALGGDPVYTYSATAPLPENINEYILAGFLRKKKVKMVRCLTQEMEVPQDADIVIEGYADPMEDPVTEGPFGDHTGFYSLEDHYPRFHITCITHRRNAIYPATVVGIPPMEDVFLALATEKIFLNPVKMSLGPEITDLHMPEPGVAHNLAMVSIRKEYPAQAVKVMHTLLGAGQMMFTKYLVVFDEDTNLRDYRSVLRKLVQQVDFSEDLLFTRGPLDVLDHASDKPTEGGKLGIDATVKAERNSPLAFSAAVDIRKVSAEIEGRAEEILRVPGDAGLLAEGLPVLMVFARDIPENMEPFFEYLSGFRKVERWYIIVCDEKARGMGYYHLLWLLLGNSDPGRDLQIRRWKEHSFFILDGTFKAGPGKRFSRDWPNVVAASEKTRKQVDHLWDKNQWGELIESPSKKFSELTLCDGAAYRRS